MQGKKGSGRGNHPGGQTQPGYVIPNQSFAPVPSPANPVQESDAQRPAAPPSAPAQRPSQPNPTLVSHGSTQSLAPIPANAPISPVEESTHQGSMPGAPGIEVEYLRDASPDAIARVPSPMLEIWTRNRVYHVDANMRCVAVISRHNNEPDVGHSLLNARLAGGQRRSKSAGAMEIVHPFPVPGTEAVFKHENRARDAYGQTSTVERVVLRIRKFRVGAAVNAEPAWDDVTGRFRVVR